MSSTVACASASSSRSLRFETAPGGSGTETDPALRFDLTEKKEIFCGFPLSNTVKSSFVNPVAGAVLLLATTSTCTSLVPALKVGVVSFEGACASAKPAMEISAQQIALRFIRLPLAQRNSDRSRGSAGRILRNYAEHPAP